jgi:lipoate-protein ligase A
MTGSDMVFSKAHWRVIQTPASHGAWNMAIDEAILEAAGQQIVPPTLRLYAWSPPCLSLGFSQPATDVDFLALRSRGWEIVRRPTGGRSILHTDELTYSVSGPYTEPRLAGSVLESYQRLSAALLETLHYMSIPALAHPEVAKSGIQQRRPGKTNPNGPVCFEVPSSYEITARGKKVIGSAQSRKQEGILQHGSLPLTGDLTRILQVLVLPEYNQPESVQESAYIKAVQRLRERATTAEECLGKPVDWETAARAYITAFSRVLNLELLPAELTPAEIQRAEELILTKYAHPDWTFKV